MKKTILSLIVGSSLLLAANSSYNYEFTPIIGGVSSDSDTKLENQKIYGFSIGRNLDENSIFDQIELGILNSTSTDYDNSTEETKVSRFFTNIIKEYEISKKTSFYSLAGLGYEKYSNEEFGNDSDGFGNYGIGLKYEISEDVSLKTDIRHIITFGGDNHLLYTVGLGISFGEKAKRGVEKVNKTKETQEPIVLHEPQKQKEVVLDDDMDNVINRLDKCPNSQKNVIVDTNGCVVALDLHINFDYNSSKIKNIYATKIKKFSNLLKKYPSLKAKINAHTDSTGSNIYNKHLSQRRAASVKEALINQYIDESRLEAIGYGESQPISSNKTEDGKAKKQKS
jgi:OOP family OmpA-OmpF porin